MSKIRDYLEYVSRQLGHDGEINDEVTEEASKPEYLRAYRAQRREEEICSHKAKIFNPFKRQLN